MFPDLIISRQVFYFNREKVQTDRKDRFNKFFWRVLINGRKWGKEVVLAVRKERPILKSGNKLWDDSALLPHG